MASEKYVVWAKATCPFCQEATMALLQRGINHTVHLMDDRPEELEKIKEQWNHYTVPLVLQEQADGSETLLGGCVELKEHLASIT